MEEAEERKRQKSLDRDTEASRQARKDNKDAIKLKDDTVGKLETTNLQLKKELEKQAKTNVIEESN